MTDKKELAEYLIRGIIALSENDALNEMSEKEEGPPHLEITAPLLIRLMEYAKETAKDDLVLHKIVERAQALHQDGIVVLGADNYNALVPEDKKN